MTTAELRITLKSDLCVASGYSYAGIVDSEVCHDIYGIPYIPARRLKGCFRETAESILYSLFDSEDGKKALENIFGKRADGVGGTFKITNARVENYKNIVDEIKSCQRGSELSEFFSAQSILDRYARVIAQTELDEYGVAKDSSLRFTRVINRYNPLDRDKELVFVSELSFDDADKEYISQIVEATKHMGLKRNRGLGFVKCTLDNVKVLQKDNQGENTQGDDECIISFNITNEEPLMLSYMSDVRSIKHITGQAMLGFFASRYIQENGQEFDEEEFADLFLNGTTKYVGAFPVKDKKVHYPAPLNINILKKSKIMVNTQYDIPKNEAQPGNQPKKLKGKYVNISDDNEVSVCDIDMRLYYHNRRNDYDGKETSGLYPSEAVEAGQEYMSYIYTKKKYEPIIKRLLETGPMLFGKSKGTQYGNCSFENYEPDMKMNKKKFAAGKKVIVTLLTDSVFMGENDYSVNAEDITGVIGNKLGNVNADNEKTMMETAVVSGYQAKWNLHKSLVPVVKAGSCFVFDTLSDIEFDSDKIWVGEKNQEGYGYAEIKELKNDKLEEIGESKSPDEVKTDNIKPIVTDILKQALVETLLVENEVKLDKVDNTQIGRVTLMLRESHAFSDKPDEQFENFDKRIKSIKTDNVRKKFESTLIKPLKSDNRLAFTGICNTDKISGKILNKLKELKTGKDEINALWYPYLLEILTNCKYEGKERADEKDN